MNNTKRNRAIAAVESAAQTLIGKAELCQVGTVEWERVRHRNNLLEAAREYAHRVLTLSRLAE